MSGDGVAALKQRASSSACFSSVGPGEDGRLRPQPGRRPKAAIYGVQIVLTGVCGIGGVLLGWYGYAAFGGGATSGVDWVRWIVAIVVAAVLVVIASTVTGRSTSKMSNFKSKFS